MIFLLSGVVLGGCGYQFSAPNRFLLCKTLSVPYVEGDQDGYLTSEIIHELIASGYHYTQSGGDVILRIAVLEVIEDDIGFRFEQEKDRSLLDSIISSEMRLKAEVRVEAIDSLRCCPVLEPFVIIVDVEFDHDYYSSPKDINRTLGQLTDIDSAREAAFRPLNRKIARQIVEYLNNAYKP